jgi:hypothetical protein
MPKKQPKTATIQLISPRRINSPAATQVTSSLTKVATARTKAGVMESRIARGVQEDQHREEQHDERRRGRG